MNIQEKTGNPDSSWVITVDMGYGHQRTAFPLKDFSSGKKVINANSYEGIPQKDRKIWQSTRKFYEFISDFKKIPIVGQGVFDIFDKFQRILSFYPKRDLSEPNFSVRRVFSLIEKNWGNDLISKLKQNPLPLISTFFTPAFMAEHFNYPGEIFCIICDADIARAWVSLNPKRSRIKYFAPNSWVVNRLKLYGVKQENIFFTGFPLPKENIGTENMEILKNDFGSRILNLDPEGIFRERYQPLIDKYAGKLPEKSDHPLTIMFSIGGAGAQKEIVFDFLKNLRHRIVNKEIKIIITAGTRETVRNYFLLKIDKLRLKKPLEEGSIEIIFKENINDYFEEFNKKLRKADILWTKPSELSFYAGLGIPIILAPTIGSQEDFNRKWLLSLGAAIEQEDPVFAEQWIFDYLKSGRFAEAAMQGFIEIEKLGVYNIQKILKHQ